MKRLLSGALGAWLLGSALAAQAELHPIKGPAKADVGDIGEIQVPEGFLFITEKDCKEFMELTHNFYSSEDKGVLLHRGGDKGRDTWAVYFSFDPVGYIKDPEKEKLEPEKMMASLKESEQEANEERRKKGWEELDLLGWQKPPFFNSANKSLEWCLLYQSGKEKMVNYHTRILGRNGVMRVLISAGDKQIDQVLPQTQVVLKQFAYKPGKRYAEWVQGDKVAEIGLAALILGGGALASKAGLFGKAWGYLALLLAKAWKLLILGVGAVVAFFKRIFGKDKDQTPKNQGPLVG